MAEPRIAERLTLIRKKMIAAGVDLLLVRSTDRFLNEYVPTEESSRVWASGFTGSMGEVLITQSRAYLAVDGRYWMQAEREADPQLFQVLQVPLGVAIDTTLGEQLKSLVASRTGKKLVVGFEAAKMTPSELEHLKKQVGEGVIFKGLFPSPVEAARGPLPKSKNGVKIRALDERRVGASVADKLRALAVKLAGLEIDALLVQRLDEIAYLSNLRGDELPYQVTFKSIALLTPEKLFIGIDPARVPNEVRLRRDSILFVPEAELWTLIGKKTKRERVGFDPHHNTEHARSQIEKTGATAVSVESPIGPLKAKKNPAELQVMIAAFARADEVVSEAQRWLCEAVLAKQRVTEADFAAKVHELFEASGAVGLSFKVISAAGKNGAIIHYSEPDPKRVIKRGELMLLDTGAYYDEGYATDLTRTFLVGSASDKGDERQCRYYTVVLKSAIAGMTAVIPEGARGYQLDALTRAPLWVEGLDYNHGTGHGVGVNVHEFPPRVGPTASAKLEEGFVFSIEPGVYLPSFGGIRIENLCTLKKSAGRPGFLEVVPLTFSPLDKRLIDLKLLTPEEKAWLADYGKVHHSPARKKLRGDGRSARAG
ncbi:MAG: M24 family metallopeptidase [Deltaproteobacteria bacterium]|nr:M24 family metallopeptidase [Deltaproteobacteria bacterium]